MSLLVNVTLDPEVPGGVGKGLASWFEAALSGPLADSMGMARAGTAWLSARTRRTENEAVQEFDLERDGLEPIRQELLVAPEWSSVLFFLQDQDKPAAHVRGSSITSRWSNMNLQLWLGNAVAPYEKPEFSSSMVDFLVAVLDSLNPAFGSVVVDQSIAEEANLDVVLTRRASKSVTEARTQLRGYSWVTVCPKELVDRLGGVSSLDRSGAFYQVTPLAAGGVVLQASPTPNGYTDDVMRGVFKVLAPVLPAGTPRYKPAWPEVRYVAEDAAERAGEERAQ